MAVCVKVKSGRNIGSSRDITIYDFANSGSKNARARKANKLHVENAPEEDTLDDETTQSSSAKNLPPPEDPPHVYSDYHIDLWYSISEYIRPEDVARFALICRKTAEVVQSAKFWQHLYRTHFDHTLTEAVPSRLQPESMSTRLRGLRPRTIRSLFYTYAPFAHRIVASPFTDPHRVAGRQLVFSWSTKTKNGWNYYFKLRARLIPGSRAERSARMQQRRETLDYLQDTYANPEEGCLLLSVTAEMVHLVPQYHEQLYVRSLTQTLAQGMGMAKYRVRLQMANYCRQVVDELVFSPVRQVRVLDWWHPEYYRLDPTILDEREGGEAMESEEPDGDNTYWDD